MSDRDRQQWQAEQQAFDAALDKQREKELKTRERSARNVQRKLERLRRTLSEAGELSEWEDEFSGSVTERLEQYGTAFHDREKGRPGDALSFAQKRVVAGLNKKAKDHRKAARLKRQGADSHDAQDDKPRPKAAFKSSFKSKSKKSFTPRVRQLDEDFDDDVALALSVKEAEPFIPDFTDKPTAKRPFLRIVKTDS